MKHIIIAAMLLASSQAIAQVEYTRDPDRDRAHARCEFESKKIGITGVTATHQQWLALDRACMLAEGYKPHPELPKGAPPYLSWDWVPVTPPTVNPVTLKPERAWWQWLISR